MHHLDISEAIISWCVFMYLRRKLWFSVLHYVTQCLAVNHPLTTDGWRRNQQGSDSCLCQRTRGSSSTRLAAGHQSFGKESIITDLFWVVVEKHSASRRK